MLKGYLHNLQCNYRLWNFIDKHGKHSRVNYPSDQVLRDLTVLSNKVEVFNVDPLLIFDCDITVNTPTLGHLTIMLETINDELRATHTFSLQPLKEGTVKAGTWLVGMSGEPLPETIERVRAGLATLVNLLDAADEADTARHNRHLYRLTSDLYNWVKLVKSARV